jgi:hypothetical protein
VPLVDLIDETFVVAPPAVVAEELKAPALWRRLFPDLECAAYLDRGDEGVRLTVSGALAGTSEFWVEPWGDGAIVHYYLRADPAEPLSPRRLIRVGERHRVRLKEGLNALKDRLEAGRVLGTSRDEATGDSSR